MLTKLLAGKWLYVAGGLLVLSLAVTARAYLGKRDELAEARAHIEQWQASNDALQDALQRQSELAKQAEQARIQLAEEVEDLRVQEVEIVTEIREVWRDREIVTEAQADCAAEPMPRHVVGLLCDAAGSTSSICSMSETSSGPANGLSNSDPAG